VAIPSNTANTVVLIGRPNVGKSTLFNRLTGIRHAITHEVAGTTRDANYWGVNWTGTHFTLVDTAGMTRPGNEIEEQSRDQLEAAIAAADVVVQVIDATTMITTEDEQAARLAHRSGKPFIVAVNKIDANRQAELDYFRRLGAEEITAVSAIQGLGTGDLLDQITARLRQLPPPPPDNRLRLALLGRPNVGKSSLLNTLAGKQSAVVSNVPGTTRDVSSEEIRYHGRIIELLDTAGMRRPGRIEGGVEKYSVLRTLASIKQADVCALLIDATEPSVAMDQNIAGLIAEEGKGLIIVVNKWDAVEKETNTQADLLRKLQHEFQFAWWAPVVFTSAATGLNAAKLFELATQIDEQRQTKLATGPLNRVIEKMVAQQAPAGVKRYVPKIQYATQTGTEPPEITLFGPDVDRLHFSYLRYLENGLRQKFDFTGTPIRLAFRPKTRDK
jgi:GTP-binding protein